MRRPTTVYLLLALAWCWPLPLHLANRFTHDPGDPLLVTYLMWWNAHAVPLTRAWWNAPFYAPMTGALALTEHLAGLSPLTTPIQWLGGSPLLAYNLVLIASTWWAGLAAHALVRRLTGSTQAAFVGGIAFAYAPYRTSQLAHLQLYACWWLPVTLLALHAYYDDGRVRWLVLCGVAWLLQGLTSGYYLLFVPILIAGWLAWFTRRAEFRRAAGVAVACAVTALAALPFLLKYYMVQTAQGLSRNTGEMIAYGATATSFLSATPMLRFWHTREPVTTEQYLFPGVTALVLALAGLAVARSDRRFRFYAGATILMAALAAGPAAEPRSLAILWHPYSWIAWLPGFGGLRVPSRFFMLAVLCLAVAAAISFAALATRRRLRVPLAVAVFAGLLVDGSISGMPLGVPPGALDVHEPGARVLALPYEDGRISVFAMYQSMTHRLPVVNGYAGYVPSFGDVMEWALRRRDETALSELRRGHALFVVIAPTEEATSWTGFMGAQPGAEFLGVQSGGAVYRMPALPYAAQPRPAIAIGDATVTRDGGWLMADLHDARTVRAAELRTHGDLVRLPGSLVVQTSADGAAWETAYDDRPGGLAVLGALDLPRVIPLRIDLRDTQARYVRVNAPTFRPSVLSVFGPPP